MRNRVTVCADLTNHGRNEHTPVPPPMTIERIAADVAELLEHLALGAVDIVGHSLGGKVAMAVALLHPSLVRRLVVLDIAPVEYGYRSRAGSQGTEAAAASSKIGGDDVYTVASVVDAMASLQPPDMASRQTADAALEQRGVRDAGTRAFVLQNLVPSKAGGSGGMQWRLNLPAIVASMPHMAAFLDPSTGPHGPSDVPTLFARGDKSKYVQPQHAEAIEALFPDSEVVAIPEAGHWLHAENPAATMAAILGHLNA